jgi:hypothetical protein
MVECLWGYSWYGKGMEKVPDGVRTVSFTGIIIADSSTRGKEANAIKETLLLARLPGPSATSFPLSSENDLPNGASGQSNC